MSVIQMRYLSETLNMFTQVNIILPLPRDAQAEVQDLPALYLLHGMGDDATAWLRKTAIERYALERGIAVIMPDGALSCYENMAHGARYRDFIARELPGIMQENFPISASREKTCIAGCSMGGCGALKLAMSAPENWSRVGCFSASHLEYRPENLRNRLMIRRAFGDDLEKRDAEITADILNVNVGKLPMDVWHCWGDADHLRPNAEACRDFFEALPAGSIRYHGEMMPGGHDWALWDESARRFMDTLNLPKPEVQLL